MTHVQTKSYVYLTCVACTHAVLVIIITPFQSQVAKLVLPWDLTCYAPVQYYITPFQPWYCHGTQLVVDIKLCVFEVHDHAKQAYLPKIRMIH